MELFDLKKFREDAELTQQEFADKIEYSQATISRIERGEKNVTDKLLLKIESKFATNLDAYKKYEKNKKPVNVNTNSGFQEAEHTHNTTDHHHFSGSELEQKYYQLLEEKSRMDERYFALSKDHELTTAELLLIKENNTLLRKIVANTDNLLLKFSEMVKM